ncbi:hypothetical protein ABH917_000253 [Thermobifida halotolerans]
MAERILGDLDQDGLAGLEHRLDPAGLALQSGGVPVDLARVQDGVASLADVDEGRLHRGQDVLHPPQVDVADVGLVVGAVDVVLDEHVVLEHGDLGALTGAADHQVALDGLAAGQELALGDDRGAAASLLAALAAALPLGLQAGGAADGLHLVLDRAFGAGGTHPDHRVGRVVGFGFGRDLRSRAAAATAAATAGARGLGLLGGVVLLGAVGTAGLGLLGGRGLGGGPGAVVGVVGGGGGVGGRGLRGLGVVAVAPAAPSAPATAAAGGPILRGVLGVGFGCLLGILRRGAGVVGRLVLLHHGGLEEHHGRLEGDRGHGGGFGRFRRAGVLRSAYLGRLGLARRVPVVRLGAVGPGRAGPAGARPRAPGRGLAAAPLRLLRGLLGGRFRSLRDRVCGHQFHGGGGHGRGCRRRCRLWFGRRSGGSARGTATAHRRGRAHGAGHACGGRSVRPGGCLCFSCPLGASGTVAGLVLEHPGGLPSSSRARPAQGARPRLARTVVVNIRTDAALGGTGQSP